MCFSIRKAYGEYCLFDHAEAEESFFALFMGKIPNDDAFRVINSALSFFKRDPMLLLIGAIFRIIPLEIRPYYFLLP